MKKQDTDPEPRSDWLHRIKELNRKDVIALLRNPTNPAMRYMLFKDGEFEGEYSTSKRLSTLAALAGNYLIYEMRIERKHIEFDFPDAPVMDAPEKTTHILITVQVDIIQPQDLISKGIWNLHDNMWVRLDGIVRDISSRYRGEANNECQADLKRHIEAQVFEESFQIVEVSVRREVPSWVGEQRNERIRKTRDAEEEKKRQEDEKRKQQAERAAEMRKKREEKEQRRQQMDDEKRRRDQQRQDEMRLQQQTVERQESYQKIFDDAGGIEGEGIEAIRAAVAAETNESLRQELLKFAEGTIERERVIRQQRLEDREFDLKEKEHQIEMDAKERHVKEDIDARRSQRSLDEEVQRLEIELRRAQQQLNERQLKNTFFSTYYPYKVEANRRYSLIAYAYTEASKQSTIQDIKKYRLELGGKISAPKIAKKTAKLLTGTDVTIMPECSEIEFSPTKLTKKWFGDWTRYEFEFRPTANLVDEIVFIRLSIQIAGIEIAHIKCSIEITDTGDDKQIREKNNSNPLLDAKLKQETTVPYQRIFISYSRRDSRIAKSYKIAQTALGNEAFLDVDNLRTGEDWRAALARAIDEADIFQLFWSEHSAKSEYCRYEWDYALKVRCPDETCEGFIRPVYWREPMPSPPPELSRINFRFVPFEDQDD